MNFLKEISELQADFIEDVLKIADKYGYDRDEIIFMVVSSFNSITLGSFKNYEIEEGK